jgi:diadenosine tetraphosphate (Ap4A) HIT family hydrolase
MMVYSRYMSSKHNVTTRACRFCTLPEPERIALVTPNFVVLMGLGPIAIGYCIIITKLHYASYAELPKGHLSEFLQVVEAVQETQTKVFGASVLFEHGRNGGCLPYGHDDELCYHAHMHLLPTAANLADAVRADYPCQVLPSWQHLSRTARRNSYLLVQDGNYLSCTVNPRALPPRYLRTKAAEQILNDATLADWQAFPSYDLIDEGKKAIQTELQLAWQGKRETMNQRAFFPRFSQRMRSAERMKFRL